MSPGVIVEEVNSGDWGIGGNALTTEHVHALAAGAGPPALPGRPALGGAGRPACLRAMHELLARALGDGLLDEVVELTRDLIRVDTTNPPGNETLGADVLDAYLARNGVRAERVARDPARANLIARVEGRGTGPTLALVGHTDVVYADPADWSTPPFGGEVHDGHLWGRGALDMKCQTAASAVALAVLARSGWAPNGDVLLIAEADEEDGVDEVGMTWLVRERPDLRCDYALNEASFRFALADGRTIYTLCVSEKMSMPVRVRIARGRRTCVRADARDNALLKLAPVLERLAAYDARAPTAPRARRVAGRAGRPACGDLGERIEHGRAAARRAVAHPARPRGLDDRAHDDERLAQAQRDSGQAGRRVRLPRSARAPSPRSCWASSARRWPTSTSSWSCRDRRSAVRARRSARRSATRSRSGSTSSSRAPLLVPEISTGFTDSHFVREAFGTIAYGFFPFRHTAPELLDTIHAPDERIDVRDLELAVRAFVHCIDRIGSVTA